jgi:sigma-B regulation protein RsbU (phosphoserine phosphatase)
VPRVEALRSSLAVSWEEVDAHKSGTRAAHHARSLLFPIVAGARRFGHVYVEFPPDHGTRNETIELLSLLVRQAALSWENLELQAARLAADQLNQELSAARQIQLQLFPDEANLDPRLELAAENMPALGISGDYYDYQLLGPGRVVFILADVMGHGLPAALLMASVQAVFRTGVRAGWDILELDGRIHDVVAASGNGETFVTGLLGLCDLTDHAITLLSAGHNWPSICSSGEPIERDERACSLPWGIFIERSPQPSLFELAPDDWSVVAYTDGVAEAPVAGGDTYGAQRLTELHRQHRGRPADEICEEILTDVLRSHEETAPQQDDITLLVLRSATEPPASARRAPKKSTST